MSPGPKVPKFVHSSIFEISDIDLKNRNSRFVYIFYIQAIKRVVKTGYMEMFGEKEGKIEVKLVNVTFKILQILW